MTTDSTIPGRRSGSDKLVCLLSMVKHDRAEKHARSGVEAADKGDWRLAVEELSSALEIFEDLREDARVASLRNSISLCYFAIGQLKKAEVESRKAGRLMHAISDAEGEATAMLGLANILFAKGDLIGSARMFERAAALFRAHCIWDGVMRCHLGLERLALKKGEGGKARRARELAEQARRQLANDG